MALGWFLLALYSLFVFISSVMPVREIPSAITRINDKILHQVVYFWLFWIAINAFLRARQIFLREQAASLSFLYCLFFGGFTEWAQSFTADRTAEWGDWFADIAAGLLGFIFYHLLKKLGAKRGAQK